MILEANEAELENRKGGGQPSADRKPSPEVERSVFKIVHEADFSCQYCGQGAETFEKAFPDNTCPHCGAGAHKCDERLFVDELPNIDQSFLVIFADDTKGAVAALLTELQAKGAHVLTLEDLMPNGMSTKMAPFVLQEAAVRAPWILFVPSAQFEDKTEHRDDMILDVVFSQILRGQPKKIMPVYLDRKHVNFAPFMLNTRLGIFLDNDCEQGIGFEKKWFLDQVPKLMADIQGSTAA